MSSRRAFVKSAGLGAVALSSPHAWPKLSKPRRADSIGIALVGLGNYSRGQLAPALQETEYCHLAGIVTGTPEKAKSWSEKYDIDERHIYDYESFDQIADDPAIDVVYVVLPNAMHAEYIKRAAAAGKHVISEKPMGVNAAECRDIIASVKAAGRKLSVGYRLQFEAHHQHFIDAATAHPLGKPTVVEASFAFKLHNTEAWRLKRALSGGGPLMDVGIYAVQAARYSTGEEPIRVTAQEYKTLPEIFKEVEETLTFQLEFPGGAVAHGMTSYNAGVNRLYVSYENGSAQLQPAYSYGGLAGRFGEETLRYDRVRQQVAQMDAFAQCIQNDTQTSVPGEEALRDAIVMDAIYQAASTRETVTING